MLTEQRRDTHFDIDKHPFHHGPGSSCVLGLYTGAVKFDQVQVL